jgi:hypothetical protein
MRLGDPKWQINPSQCFPCRDISQIAATDPLAGFVGYELLARFAVRLDYDGGTLMLSRYLLS